MVGLRSLSPYLRTVSNLEAGRFSDGTWHIWLEGNKFHLNVTLNTPGKAQK